MMHNDLLSLVLTLTPASFNAFTLNEYVLPGRRPRTVQTLSIRW